MPDVASHLRDAGFSDDEIAAWAQTERANLTAAGFSDDEVDQYLGIPRTPKTVPPAFIERLDAGQKLAGFYGKLTAALDKSKDTFAQMHPIAAAAAGGAVEAFGNEPIGVDPEKERELYKTLGIPENMTPLFLGIPALQTVKGGVAALDLITRGTNAGIRAVAEAAGETAKTLGEEPGMAERMKRDINSLGQIAVILSGPLHTSMPGRVVPGPGGVLEDQKIGGLPKGEDFSTASAVISRGDTTPAMENKLLDLYEKKGIHPAEVAQDAQKDVTITQSILSADMEDMPSGYGYQFHGYEPLPGATKAAEESVDALRAAKLDANVREPYFQNVPGRGRPKTAQPYTLGTGEVEDTGVSPVSEGFEVRPITQEESLREKVLLEGKEVAYTEAEKQILSKISVGEKAPTSRLTWGQLYTNFLDKLYPIAREVKKVEPGLPAEDNPYQLARLLSGHVGKADHFLNEATFDFKTYEQNGPSLKEILTPINDDLNGFRAYAAAERVLELEGRGIKSGFASEETSAPPLVSSGLDNARSVLIEGKAKYAAPFRALIDYQNRVSGYLRDSGVLSEAGYNAMVEANKMYVPFTRVMGIDEAAQARGGSTLQAKNPIKEIKGSARAIVDPIESVVRNTYHMIEMAEKNVVGTKLVDMLKRASTELDVPSEAEAMAIKDSPRAAAMADALGEIGVKKPDELASALAHASEPVREGEIAILRDGKRETYKVDPELARAMKGLDAQSMSMLERALAYPASILRAGAVTTPEFAGRHTIRDFLYATVTGKFSPMDMARGFSGLIMKDADYWNWLKGGGGNISMVGLDRQYLQQDLRELTGQTGLVGRAWNVLADPNASMWQKTASVGTLPFQAIDKFVLDPLRTLTQFAENASHLGAFKKSMRTMEETGPTSLRDQIIRSAWQSRDIAVDAARMGASMRAYNMITAFANIKLQDTDRVVRAIKDNPASTLVKIGGAITVPSVVLWSINHDDPDYQELPQWQKDMFWIVPMGSAAPSPLHVQQAQQRGVEPTNSAAFFMRVPKPWAMGMVFGTAPERLLDQFWAQKPEAFKDYFKKLWETSGPEFVPTAASPILDQATNRSIFTNRTLIPSAQEKFLPEYQYTPYTSELAKQIGQTVGAFPGMDKLKVDNSGWGGVSKALISPILIENYVRGWTGTLGTYALQAADLSLRKAGLLPDPPQPTRTLADIPVIRAFVVRYPTASAESIQNFQDEYAKNKAYLDTYKRMADDGNIAAMKHIEEMGGPMMFAQLDGVHQTITEHNQLIRDLYKNPGIEPDQKRQLIDTLYFNMIMVSRGGMEMIRQLHEKAADTVSKH